MDIFENKSDDQAFLSAEQVQHFQQKGAIYIPGVATRDEMDFFRPAINGAVQKNNTEKRKMEERDTYGKAFLQVMNLWEVDENVRKFSLNNKFAKIAAQLLGVERVRIYHDQALYKESGGGATPWHQDQYYWPLDTQKTVTMWMPLIDIDVSMGMLTFAEGSHKDGLVKSIPISDESQSLLEDYVAEKGYPIFRPDFMEAGDATFHYGYTLHKAPGNSSNQLREVMTVIYYADGAVVTQPENDYQEADRKRWFNGLNPGELAASILNPVV